MNLDLVTRSQISAPLVSVVIWTFVTWWLFLAVLIQAKRNPPQETPRLYRVGDKEAT